MTKQTHLTLRLAQAEATEIEAEAAAAGVSVSAYVRQALARRLDIERLGAYLARDLAAELRADAQAQAADLDAKLKLISDQLAALSLLVQGGRK